MNKGKKRNTREENELLENYTGASSSGDCTGLIPSGGNHSPEEFEKISEYKNEEAERLNK